MDEHPTRFKEGNPGGPGRPKGSRNKLSELFISTLAKDFEAHGVDVIERLRNEQPAVYANVIGRLMPKLLELSGPDGDSIPISGEVVFVKEKNDGS